MAARSRKVVALVVGGASREIRAEVERCCASLYCGAKGMCAWSCLTWVLLYKIKKCCDDIQARVSGKLLVVPKQSLTMRYCFQLPD